MSLLFKLLVVMQFKHFIADYPLQNKYMLGKFKEYEWALPLAAHCGVHFLFTFVISFLCTYDVYFSSIVAAIDFMIHFIMDRIKASPNLLGQYKALTKKEYIKYATLMESNTITGTNGKTRHVYNSEREEAKEKIKGNTIFWWSLGLDQMVHHLTDILVVYLIWSAL